MNVIIPVHEGDRDLCIKNLEHALILEGGKVDFHAVVHHETGFEAGEVVKAAQNYFTSVVVSAYPKWGGNKAWPWPQNNAWKRAAQYVESTAKDSWLWWEADAVPLRARWLFDIDSVYTSGGRPFAGACVQFSGVSYMAGVGVYPRNPSELMPQAMLANGAAWDIVAGTKDHILQKTHDISTLIHHVPDAPNTHFDSLEDVQRKIKPTAVLFHKCKDGSLIDVLQGKLGPSDSSTPAVVSVFDQHPEWPSGLFAFPYESNVCYFNCSILEKSGKRYLFTRRQRRDNPQATQSDLAIWEIRSNMTVKWPPIIPKIPKHIDGQQFDDPRAVLTSGGKVLVSLAHWIQGKPWPCRQVVLQLTDDMRGVEMMFHPKFGGNHDNPEKATGAEKNWTFLNEPHAPLKFSYQLNPHILFSGEKRWDNPKLDLPWTHGELRGGTPAVDIGTHWVSFFHSSTFWTDRPRRLNRYYMGAIAWLKTEPHPITHITPKPIFSGSEEDFRTIGGPPCCFPGGCLYNGRHFLVTMGLNDQECAYIFIPSEDLEKLLEPV